MSRQLAAAILHRQVTSPHYIVVTAPTISGSDERREEYGQLQLRFLEAHLDRIAFGGQVKAVDGTVAERLYLVKGTSRNEARALMEGSPYCRAELKGETTS
jgi:uncharacterized protein YciI